jgi:hypothetical protein
MATFNENEGGLIVAPEPPPKPKRAAPKKKKVDPLVCRSCGFVGSTKVRGMKVYADFDNMCRGCAGFFGNDTAGFEIMGSSALHGATNLSMEETLIKLDECEEAKHVLLLKSQSFGVPETGDSIGVDFGDVFEVSGFGNTSQITPTGKGDWAMKAYTITIKINGHALTLFMHEVTPIHWVTLMELKKAGDYQEAYLSSKDSGGYWKPSDETKASIVNMYGDR